MRWRKVVAALALCGASIGISASAAGAHSINVQPAGNGQGTCQFMGGPGNPGHQGHSHGHLVAQGAEQSDVVSIGGC